MKLDYLLETVRLKVWSNSLLKNCYKQYNYLFSSDCSIRIFDQ